MSDHDSSVEIARLQAEVKKLTGEQTDCYTDLNSARQDNGSFTTEFKRLRAEIERLQADVQTWQGHAKTAIWSDSAECKLLAADNERLRAAMDVVRASGLLIGSTTLHDRVRAVVHAALTQEKPDE